MLRRKRWEPCRESQGGRAVKSQTALRRFEVFLAEKKLRLTLQRKDILELAWSTHDHFSADEMAEWTRKTVSRPSRATVYRTLCLLVEGGFLSSVDRGRSGVLYEHILGHSHHDHMVCLNCGKIIEFRCQEIEDLQEREAAKHHFRLVRHTLLLEGMCGTCPKKRA